MSASSPPEYPAADQPGAGRRRDRERVAWVLTLVLTPVLVALAVFTVSHSDSTSRHTSSTMPTEIAPGAPYDGKESKRLPVRVTPDTNVIDGQVVTVSGSGFPANTEIALAECTNAAQQQGIDACDLATSTYMNGQTFLTTSDGTFSVPFVVRRHLTIAGQPVDCALGNVDPADYQQVLDVDGPFSSTTMPGGFTCLVGAAVLADYDVSGGWPIAFEGAVFGEDAPTPTTPIITAAPPPSSYIDEPYGTAGTVPTGRYPTETTLAPPVTTADR